MAHVLPPRRSDTAAAAARANQPDAIISDLGLPGELDGYGLAKALRADPELSDVYLVALSGYGRDDDRQRAQAAGFDRHLAKPVDAACLDGTLSVVPNRSFPSTR